jgi:predicted dehydrogenase/nucleoside-diphosphate-sugar epimerase
MSAGPELRVGLVGAGYVSAYHARALKTLPHVRIVGLADLSRDRAQALAAQFAIPSVYESLSDMREARPDVLHILTPPASHCQLTLEALAMGCHVFVEKPMALTRQECDAMVAEAQRVGRVLSVNHSAKADPIVLDGLARVNRGACGDLLSVDMYRGSDYPPYAGGPLPAHFRDGGYPFHDIGVHALYLIEAFLGRIQNVDVRYRSTGKDPHVFFDEWRGTVECRKGVGHFLLSWSARPIRNELFIRGTNGVLHIDCFRQTCTLHRSLPGPKAISANVDALAEAAATLVAVPRNMVRVLTGRLRPSPGIHAGVVQFHEALRRHAEPPVTMDEGRRMVGWLEDVCRAADLAKRRALRDGPASRPATILVTGAAGFLGSALLRRLCADQAAIRVLVRRPAAHFESMPDVQVTYGDVGDADAVDRAVAGVETVYHVAATMRGRHEADFQAGTVAGTANIVDGCVRHGVKRLVYVSSMSVLDYASHAPGTVVTEAAALEPRPTQRGSYTQSKLDAERTVLNAVRDRGLHAVILRPGQIVGPGAESVPPYGTIQLAGRWIVVGGGRLALPLVYIEDVVDALVAAGRRPGVEGSIFHVVDPATVTQDDYIAMCRHYAGDRLRVLRVPRLLLLWMGAALEMVGWMLGRRVPLSRYRIRSINDVRFDCTKAKTVLGWTPRTGVDAGLKKTFFGSHQVQLHDGVDGEEARGFTPQNNRAELGE